MPEKAFNSRNRGNLADKNQIVQNRPGKPDQTSSGVSTSRANRKPDISSSNVATVATLQRPVVFHNDDIEPTVSAVEPSPSAFAFSHSSQVTQDSLHIPTDGSAQARPGGDNTIWDWKAPSDPTADQESYFYEPQGELVHEEQQQSRQDFTIPHPVFSSGVNWRAATSPLTANSESAFAIPGRPSVTTASAAGLKRKSISDKDTAGANRKTDPKRLSIRMEESTDEPPSPTDTRPTASTGRTQSVAEASSTSRRRSNTESRPVVSGPEAGSGQQGTTGRSRSTTEMSGNPILPARKVFPIQIGDRLFRLSGASISSDGPSYFTQFFEEQLRHSQGAENIRTLYIDRDPATFEDIALHLQGYHVEPKDGKHFVKLFADAQFFSLPRLTSQLFTSTIYIRIGDGEFQIPRDLFNGPGDSPNYFSLGFSVFFSTPTDAFPGLSQRTLLRPPSILPPCVTNRSARTFADLLHILKGYPVEIRSEEHRQELLRDARYFHLKGLEQRLIPCSISYNLARQRSELVIRIDDIRQSGISFVPDNANIAQASAGSPASSIANSTTGQAVMPGWIQYQRPYIDSESHSLVMEISGEECTFLSIAPPQPNVSARIGRATFRRQMLSRVTSLFTVIANKMNLPVTQPLGVMMMERGAGVASLPVSPGNSGLSEEKVKIRVGTDADVIVDGKPWFVGEDEDEDEDESSMEIDPAEASTSHSKKHKRRQGDEDEGEEWVVKRSQWRLRVQPVASNSGGLQSGSRTGMEIILGAVKIEAFSSERQRNADRGFLTK